MNLYHVKRTDRYGYDEYDSFVVWANNVEEARYYHPDNDGEYGYKWSDEDQCWKQVGGRYDGQKVTYGSWPINPRSLDVIRVSAPESDKPVLLCSSYNAG